MTRFDPIDFLERAVRTPSDDDVTAMRGLLVDTLRDHDADPRVDDAGNVLATRGTGRPHVVLNTHIDTVSPHVTFERDGDVLRGRGACDAKGPLAALVDAFLATDVHVTLAVTPDEETDSTGAAALDLDADAYIVGEPTGLDACNAARGRFEGVLTLRGENAHAAEPETGVNAVAAAEPALRAVRSFDDAHGPPAHDALGDPDLTPTRIRGGDAANQVPDACEITLDRRSVPPETPTGFEAALDAHVRDAVPTPVEAGFSLIERPAPFLEAWATPGDAAVVTAVADAAGGRIRPFTAATEAAYFAAAAPTVVFGPGVLADDEGAVAHADREYVRAPDVERAAAALGDALSRLTG